MTDAQSDERFQQELLNGVARSFALTIPLLPGALRSACANAYLLCRIADCIEDRASVDFKIKHMLAQRYLDIVTAASSEVKEFIHLFESVLSADTLPAERVLIRRIDEVIAITRSLPTRQQQLITLCVSKMTRGMVYYQAHSCISGMPGMSQLDNYCYHVAGVVGELLTELWCDYSPELAQHRESLLQLSVSFAEGLQLTNVLKDFWEDHQRQVCWLPADLLSDNGQLDSESQQGGLSKGLHTLLAKTHRHLLDATTYLALIPAREIGLRKFSLWAIAMAFATLRRISRKPEYRSAAEVKIKRYQLLVIITLSSLFYRSKTLTSCLLRYWSRGLPLADSASTNTDHSGVQQWFDTV